MSIRQGKKLIASSTTNGFNLFDCKWADHILNNISWLRADTFSWQSGDVYTAAYEHLVDDIDGNITAQTDTIGDITITYFLSEDGHKICLPYRESDLVALYNKTGVAWYYLIDTTNRRFKLPRTKWGFTGLRDSVGGYVAPGLPDHNHKIIIDTKWGSKNANNGPNWCGDDATRATNIAATSTNASQSNSIYGASNTVQPPATQMYLYFYVGNFEQSAIEQTAGITSEQLNNKADISLFNDLNSHKVISFQAPTSANGYTWYRKYADGWVEQGVAQRITGGGNVGVVLPVPMADANYTILISQNNSDGSGTYFQCQYHTPTATGFTVISEYGQSRTSRPFLWYVCGMSA